MQRRWIVGPALIGLAVTFSVAAAPTLQDRVHRTESDIADLEKRVEKLAKRVDDQDKEIDELRAMLSPGGPDVQKALARNEIVVGMTIKQVRQIMDNQKITFAGSDQSEEIESGVLVKRENWTINRPRMKRLAFKNGKLISISD